MSLNEVLAALSENDIKIEIAKIIVDENVSDEEPIIEFEASGYEALNAELLEQTVSKIKVDRSSINTSITIIVESNQESNQEGN